MKINITRPIFKCQHDETIFFERLSQINGFEGVIEDGHQLNLSVDLGNEQVTLQELQSICDIWNTEFNQ